MERPATIPWTCTACGFSAPQPASLAGRSIYCPRCHAPQVLARPGTDRVVAERIPTGRIARTGDPDTARYGAEQRIDFHCTACGFRTRIAAGLAGHPVRCAQCGTVQLAGMEPPQTVRLDEKGRIPFVCSACGYQARLPADYAGKAIRCPKCQAAQVVPRIQRDPPTDAVRPPSQPLQLPLPNDLVPLDAITPLGVPTQGRPSASPAGPAAAHPQAPLPPPSPRAPPPSPAPAAPAPPLPPATAGDELDLDAPEPAKTGAVVRRSGRLEVPAAAAPASPARDETTRRHSEPRVTAAGQRATATAPPPPSRPWLVPTLLALAALLVLAIGWLAVLYLVADSQVEHLTRQLSEWRARSEAAERGLAETRRDLEALRAALERSEAGLAARGEELAARERELTAARQELAALRAELERLRTREATGGQPAPAHP